MPHKDLSKDRVVKAIKPPPSGKVDYFDTALPGFALRVTSRGVKSWCCFYRVQAGPDKGKLRRMTLEPRYPALSCKDARALAGDVFAAASAGHDPAAEKQVAKKAAPPPKPRYPTLGDVIDGFIKTYAMPRQRTWKETERTLKTNCADWLDRPVESITKAEVYDLLDGFIADGHVYKAARTLSWLRKLFRWAAKRDIIESSIIEGVEIDFEERKRDRHYSDSEVAAIWRAAGKLSPIEEGYVKLTLLLGVRKNELAGMRHAEFDDAEKPTLWTVPNERTKTRKTRRQERVYVVPLPKLAQQIVVGIPKVDADLVFPGRHHGKPMHPGSPLQRKIRELSGVSDWTYHACRDTIATWLQDQGHSEHERGLVLNHAETSITAEYSHGYPVKLKRKLLERWAEHVENLVRPDKG